MLRRIDRLHAEGILSEEDADAIGYAAMTGDVPLRIAHEAFPSDDRAFVRWAKVRLRKSNE
jgi:hypothetical protein